MTKFRMKFSRKVSIDQRSLPFGGGKRSGIFAHALPWERRLVAGMGFFFLAFALLYVYFVMASVVHVAAYRDLLGKVKTAQNVVSELESAYYAKSGAITETYAESLGYVTVADRAFVARNTALTLQ